MRGTNPAMRAAAGLGLLLAAGLSSANAAGEPSSHPWLDKQLAKQRYACPVGQSPVRGPADAKVTVVEFVDFDCPSCAQQEPVLAQLLAAYPAQVKLVIKNLPLSVHPGAKQKALVAECLGLQGKYWQAHDGLLSGASPQQIRAGADPAQLKACVDKGGEGQVDRDLALARRLGMATTPGFVIDGIRQGGTIALPQLKLLVDAELSRKAGPATN
jgi:protein-disulfide isomerase